MWKPDESLDDFIVKPDTHGTVDPPRKVWLRPTSQVEILKPLASEEVPATGYLTNARKQPLWFGRLIAVGSGALILIALVLVSAILIGISEPAAGPEVAIIESEDKLIETEEPFGILSSSSLQLVSSGIDNVRSNIRRNSARPNFRVAVHKPKRRVRPSYQPKEPKFVPTTLVIYAENGVINTRIEPWLQVGDKKLPTLSN